MIKLFLIVLTVVILSGFYTNAIAQSYGTIDKTTTKLSFSPKDAVAEKTIDVVITITNTSDETIKISKSKHINSWVDDLAQQNTVEIKPRNSNLLNYRLHVPGDIPPNTYQMIFEIVDSNGNTSIVQGDLVIKGAAPIEIDFTSVLALLAIYYVPAQFIERILELLKLTSPRDPNLLDRLTSNSFNNILQKITSLEKEVIFFESIRKSMIDKKISIFNEKYNPKFIEDNMDKWTKDHLTMARVTMLKEVVGTGGKPEEQLREDVKLDDLYRKGMSQIDNIIANRKTLLSMESDKQATLIWAFSLAIAIIPAILFSIYGIGLLQILGLSGRDIVDVDVIINILFIGSGTKPIHDIMTRISTNPQQAAK